MSNVSERPRPIKSSRAYFTSLISNPPTDIPVLTCHRVGAVNVETEQCPFCCRKHTHGADGLDVGVPDHRASHCTVPTVMVQRRGLAAGVEEYSE